MTFFSEGLNSAVRWRRPVDGHRFIRNDNLFGFRVVVGSAEKTPRIRVIQSLLTRCIDNKWESRTGAVFRIRLQHCPCA